ncbi:hypothetical protein QFZ79_001854 [Arthrobacter sp. V4I6]|uniref:PfkB family carbohydrate kinase n=1 Tax=unclassified Arthrobacter TaxID=235627 RepID=UPI00277F89AF|nr:hypothetical protein [Arthrobacter sp. V1I7]MDQ0853743.1 hypothetical protein [Arthrobacter sp. V4I6]
MHPHPTTACPDPDVIVVGEALIDIIQTADGFEEFPGGSALNVASGLARLGVPTALLTAPERRRRPPPCEVARAVVLAVV